MKRIISIFAALLLILQLSACQHSDGQEADVAETVSSPSGKIPTILVDGDYYNTTKYNPVLNYAQYLNPGYSVNFEVLSSDPTERSAQITEILAEIEAGGGPDVFLLPTIEPGAYSSDGERKEALFSNMEIAMRSDTFLPLDSYLAQSDLFHIQSYYEDIMNAGITADGQMILPILYSYQVFWWNKEYMQDPNMQPENWEAMLAYEDEQIQCALYQSMITAFGAQYGDLVDYENKKLLITPEVLANDLQKLSAFPKSIGETGQPEVSYPFTWNEKIFSKWNASKGSRRTFMLPNNEGGTTAFITAYAAINRNTECPDEAFRFIELHMSNEVQSGQGIYDGESDKYYGRSMSLNSKHFGLKNGGVPSYKNAWTDFGLISDMNQKITSVRFYSDMDLVLLDAWNEAQTINYDSNAAYEDYLQIAKVACDKMELLLSE